MQSRVCFCIVFVEAAILSFLMEDLRDAIFRRCQLNVDNIIAEIDSQIAKLQQARSIIAGTTVTPTSTGAKRGRPKGSKNAASVAAPKKASKVVSAPAGSKRKLSPEGRKAIADAMKKRWAERKKQAAK